MSEVPRGRFVWHELMSTGRDLLRSQRLTRIEVESDTSN